MEENNIPKKEMPLAGWIAILVALVAGVVLIFTMLEIVMPKQWDAQTWDEMTVEKGRSGSYQIRMLQETEWEDPDIRTWLEHAEAEDVEDGVFWLYRQDSDEYVLYLPQQDRALAKEDLSASEENDSDGEITLVLRARTPEEGGEVDPEKQLFAIRTDSEAWRGIRVKVILDGREKDVYKLASKEGKLYSTEEVYIGRDID